MPAHHARSWGHSVKNAKRLSRTRVVSRSELLETLESRVLLSTSQVMTPDFVVRRPTRHSIHKNAINSPTGLTPAIIRQAYGINQVSFGGVTGDGSGQSIAIVDAYNDPNISSDLHAFDQQFGLADPTLHVINEHGGTTLPGTDPAGRGDSWALETSLDVEWAHSVAPGATIVLVLANSANESDLMAAVNAARNYAGVSVVSMSWGGDESSADLNSNSTFTTPSGHTPVTFIASSGDSGAFGSTGSKTVGYPAASPNVVAAGGTTLVTDASGDYISESGWGSGSLSSIEGGSGGGISKVEAQPSYQKGVVTQSTSFRTVPDVAFDADPNSGVAVYDSWDSPTSPWEQIGGTSLASPMWAGVIAIADQGRVLAGEATLDSRNDTLPRLYAVSSADFHDITTGNNGYQAGPGYDLVTGRGTPIVNKLVPDLVAASVPTPPPPAPTPVIGSFTINPGSVVSGTAVTLSASNVTETGGSISTVNFYLDSDGNPGLQIGSDTLIGTGVKSGSTWTISAPTTGLAPGSYTYYAVATDAASNTTTAAAALTVTPPAPSNDNFANAAVETGTSFSIMATNVNATKQPGEPNVAGNSGGRSVWFNWTAPSTGRVSLDTHGSNFDTLLGVYTGGSVSALTRVASNDDDLANFTRTSAVAFNAVAGVTYHIVVDGYNGASGTIILNLFEAVPPTNDNFSNASKLTGSNFTIFSNNIGATRQSGDPFAGFGGASVWFTWTAPSTGTVSLDTSGSNFDTILGVFTGGSLPTLTTIAANDDAVPGFILTSAVQFHAVAGTTYSFDVDGYNGAMGDIQLNLNLTSP